MLESRILSRRQFLFASAGAAIMVLAPSRQAGAAGMLYSVISGPLNMRSGPGVSYNVLTSLPVGTSLDVLEAAGSADGYSWVKATALGKTGYVADTFIARAGMPDGGGASFPVGTNVVTTSALNLRSGAGTTYSVIVTLWSGAPVTITGAPVAADGYTWYPVRTGYGTNGWVAGSFLSSGAVSNPAFPVGSTATSTTNLNVRGGAGLSYSVIVTLWDGAVVTITGAPVAASGYTWYPVKTGYGTTGWVAGEFLSA